MPKYIVLTAGIFLLMYLTPAVEARPQPYTGNSGESPQLVKCKQEAQYIGAGGKSYDTHAESNRILRKEYMKNCMQGK